MFLFKQVEDGLAPLHFPVATLKLVTMNLFGSRLFGAAEAVPHPALMHSPPVLASSAVPAGL